MDKVYNHQLVEQKWYQFWEENGYFKPEINPEGKPYCILLPPPNANAPLHMGHAMYVIEDILIRHHRMLGDSTLFLPGTDHAGIETQFVFEKKLREEGKSRFDFDRETLYKMIAEYVEKNRGVARDQMKKLGFSLDWSREKFTLQPEILKTVFETFKKLFRDGLIYRTEKIVNYCTHCGTAFSELEVLHVEKDELLYYLDYGPIKIATARPETIFADVAVAVNLKDKRYKNLIGKTAVVPIINREVPIIADEAVEMEFGTGALKITPGHDLIDFEIGERHNLPTISCIESTGKMCNVPKDLVGLYPKQAREKTVELLKQANKLIKTEPLQHTVGTCYRCKNSIEPLLIPQWFIKIKPLAKPAIKAVKEGKIKIFPTRFKKLYLTWMKNIRDWNISRQIVWGPRIPVWYCLDCNPEIKINFLNQNKKLVSGLYQDLKNNYSFEEIKSGLQTLTAPVKVTFIIEDGKLCPKCKSPHLLQETDTFDTWFSSGQWPFATLRASPNKDDFKKFYPTSLLDTMWDILFFWVARMIMSGLYLTKDVPFRIAHMHSRVVDIERKKMSKSKGNVINPIDIVSKYGADALRMALVFGTAPASDIVVTEDKIRAMRNFTNKLWNITRFILLNLEGKNVPFYSPEMKLIADDKEIISKLSRVIEKTTKNLKDYHFGQTTKAIYEFTWHEFADIYIEQTKERIKNGDLTSLSVLRHVLLNILKLLHPFMPFLTEELWSKIPKKTEIPLIISSWPKILKS